MTGGLSTISNAIAKRLRCPPDRSLALVFLCSYNPIASKICFIYIMHINERKENSLFISQNVRTYIYTNSLNTL